MSGYGYPGRGHRHEGRGDPPPEPEYGYNQYVPSDQDSQHQYEASTRYNDNYGPPRGHDRYERSNQGGHDRYERSNQGGHDRYERSNQGRHDRYERSNQGSYRRDGAPPPPSGQQQFGHGAPDGYTFQYSNCTGKRKALLIGINYFGQKGELRGCVNDVKNVSAFLVERYGYRMEDMVILTDDQQNPISQPTKTNVLRAMNWLVAGAQPNDSLFLHYSGHGGQTEDLDGDEQDGTDEVIYPVDFRKAGHIVDDEIHHIIVTPLQPGVRLTAIFDSCHSGSVLDLPYIYSTKGVLKEPNLAKEAGQGLLSAVSAYARGDMGGIASSIFGFAKSAYSGDDAYNKTIETKTSSADVIMWSGSKDDQTSADATISSQATGAMSYAFIKAIKQNPKQSYVQLLNSIREILENEYSQKPQLSCSHPLDTSILFVM